ncbi:cytochrome-c peroxidase [Alteromonas facilis]|uniref:cytochrome-c peroxidase n=1 Tax=Alteromonas facilis TaxID=2048004 RepID=UPI000C290B00|nr:cytochrome c peroxidase [Alteromonas facilis]
MNRTISAVIIGSVLFIAVGCGGGDSVAQSPEVLEPVIAPPTNDPVETEQPPSENEFSNLRLPETPFNYADITLPEHYQVNQFSAQFPFQRAAIDFNNTPTDNPITNSGATLGRVLFYDKTLSANGTVACASCHLQSQGFADPKILSIGFDGEATRRHSMGLANAVFYASGRFFWDERASSLEEQVLIPFQDPAEMGLVLAELEELVSLQPYYPILFENAFGDSVISTNRIAMALSQFVRSMVSTTSKYDLARSEVNSPTEPFPAFSEQENEGKDLFFLPRQLDNGDRVVCASCHVSEAFVGPIPNGPQGSSNATVNGIDQVSIDDLGVYEATGNQADIGKFKAPSLKNIGVTAPYMHNGRFPTLSAVVDHYSSGVQAHQNLSRPLIGSNGLPIQFNFSQEEKDALVAFLHTLTDEQMLQDEKFSDPFIE